MELCQGLYAFCIVQVLMRVIRTWIHTAKRDPTVSETLGLSICALFDWSVNSVKWSQFQVQSLTRLTACLGNGIFHHMGSNGKRYNQANASRVQLS